MSKDTHQLIIKKALQKLILEEDYTQAQIVQKFKQLDIPVSSSSISNLKKDISGTGAQLLKKAAKGLLIIMERELCLYYNTTTSEFEKKQNCIPSPIITAPLPNEEKGTVNSTIKMYDGRIDVAEKVNLYNYAASEVIEIGIRLKSFRGYFSSKRESAFLAPITSKLEAGVNFKCYIADSKGNFLRRYIEDRSNENLMELEVLKNISDVTSELIQLFTSINRNGHKGKMELYRYDHFPYYHASIADGGTERGLMYISPYLYGVSRANSPVTKLVRKQNKILYKRYWQSVKSFIHSKQVFQIPT